MNVKEIRNYSGELTGYKVTENGAETTVQTGQVSRWLRKVEKWIEAGNTPDPYVAPPAPPITVTPWQFRKALNRSGKRKQVEDYVNATTTSQDFKDGWEYATEFVEDDALIVEACTEMGLTDADRKQLFELAATL